jgi:hypothetical protein
MQQQNNINSSSIESYNDAFMRAVKKAAGIS